MQKNWSRIVLATAAVGMCAVMIGWFRNNITDPVPEKENPLQQGVPLDPGTETQEQPALQIFFDDGSTSDSEKTMRFGLIITAVKDENTPTGFKQLTWHPQGLTSNACLKIDGEQYLFGHLPGQWVTMEAKLGKDAEGNKRLGRKSIMEIGGKITTNGFPECGNLLRGRAVWGTEPILRVMQIVEIVRGPLTGKLDTCQVKYVLENRDSKAHQVGLRFLLDTLVGTNDGAPFVVPGRDFLIEKQWEFNNAAKLPPFVFALEEMKLNAPGIVAQIGLVPKLEFGNQVGGMEAPARLTLGGWPNEQKIKGAKGGLTLWDVPVFPLDKFQDSAATMYWAEKELAPGGKRTLGFTYGLGQFTGNKSGSLGFFLAGDPRVDGELVVTALVKDAEFGQKVTLKGVSGLGFVDCQSEQTIMVPPQGKEPFSPVSWKVRPTDAGKLPLRIDASVGVSHEYTVEIRRHDEK